jgi:ribokinase
LKKSANIVVVGSANTDMIIALERIPKPGETLLGGEFFSAAGGKGANQAVAAARAGGSVSLVARLGTDSFGDEALKGYLDDGINVKYVRRDPHAASGMALIFVAKGGENSIAVAGGANARLSSRDIQRAAPLLRRADVLLMQLETPLDTVQAAARRAAACGVRVILNPAPARPLPAALLRHVCVLTPNETEAEQLTGIKIGSAASMHRAALKLKAAGVQTVILTLGARGAYVFSDEFTGLIPGFKVKPLDTTAAGDVFNGALAVALGEGGSLQHSVRFACAAAALWRATFGANAPRDWRVLEIALSGLLVLGQLLTQVAILLKPLGFITNHRRNAGDLVLRVE